MRLLRQKVIATNTGVKSREFTAQITCGPETAARLGVPVGTIVDLGRVAYWHRNPIKRWRGQRKIAGGFDANVALPEAYGLIKPA